MCSCDVVSWSCEGKRNVLLVGELEDDIPKGDVSAAFLGEVVGETVGLCGKRRQRRRSD